MSEAFDYDVFISYSSDDKDWVRGELLQRIEKAGLRACIDYRDFPRGMPSIVACEQAVQKSRKTLVILTPSYVKSGWAAFESILLQTDDPANETLRLIPLLRATCEKPRRVAALTHIDSTDGADHDLAWRQLITALGKPPEPEPPKEAQRDGWFLAHPYPMSPHFSGRVEERATLNCWLDKESEHPLLILRALGGFGKSALTWHWLMHDVDPANWPRVAWWSFYEGDASFESFLAETLHYLSDGKGDSHQLGGKNAIQAILKLLVEPGTLLVLDGFERLLRAFGGLNAAYQGDDVQLEIPKSATGENGRDCISPLADLFLYHLALQPNLKSKVLLTTRLRPRVLEARGRTLLQGCREQELRQMRPSDSVAFFCALGIRGTHTEIETACAPYGYHPLSLRLLAGLIVGDFQQPGDIAAASRLDVSGELVQRQHHVLSAAYNTLTLVRQALLGRIACFRSAVRYEALKAIAAAQFAAKATTTWSLKDRLPAKSIEIATEDLDSDLRDLVARGLLQHDTKESRFDLHPIVRRYAYDRLAAPDRALAHTRLRDYFAAVPRIDKVTRLEELAPVVELFHHTARAGRFDNALDLYRHRLSQLYYQFGAYQLIIDLMCALFPDGEARPPRLKDEREHAWALNELSNSCSLGGQPRRAVLLIERAVAIDEKFGDKKNLAIDLGNLAGRQAIIGALRTANTTVRRSIDLSHEIKDELSEATALCELGEQLAYRGEYSESELMLAKALAFYESIMDLQGQSIVWQCRANLEFVVQRSRAETVPGRLQTALGSARRAFELADATARTQFPVERDFVRAHWLLGAAHRAECQYIEAELNLHESLERCRRINLIDSEADILIDLARLRSAMCAQDEARRLVEESLVIAERCGYVLQGADAHLELAKLALARDDKDTALHHATEARRLATCDGPPDYTYKVAYDEAEALLEHLQK